MIDYFDSRDCLKTYTAERNPSVSANCNALLAILLDSDEIDESQSKIKTIEKVTAYICESWSNANGALEDKWASPLQSQRDAIQLILTTAQNLSGYYPAMLMCKAFITLLKVWDSGGILQVSHKLLCERVMPVLLQCLIRTLHSQQLDGSWGFQGPREETAYAILTLSNLRTLPLAQYFRSEIISAIDRGRSFLKSSDPNERKYLWIEKVSYTSSNLTETYITAAIHTSITHPSLGERARNLCSAHDKDLAGFASRIDRSPLSKQPRWLVLGSWIDSRLYVSQLQKSLGDNGAHQALKDYAEKMAFRWVFSNYKFGSVFSSRLICNMIDVTILSKHLAAMADNALLSSNRNLVGSSLENSGRCLSSLQTQGFDSHKMVTSHATSNGISKLYADYHVPELRKENRLHSASENSDVKDEESWPNSQNTVSLLLGLLDGSATVAEAGRCARAAAQSELDRVLHAQIARMEKQGRECPSECETYETKPRQLGSQSSPATVAWRLILAFAICLAIREKAGIYWTTSQERVLQDVRGCIMEIQGLEHELTRPCRCSPVSRSPRYKDDITEIISYERDRLDLALRQLRKIGVKEDVTRAIEVIIDVADQTAKDVECGWL